MAKQGWVWFLVLLLISVNCLGSCSSKDEESAIRELIKKGATLAEEQDIKGLINLTTEDFSVLPAELGRQETRRILFGFSPLPGFQDPLSEAGRRPQAGQTLGIGRVPIPDRQERDDASQAQGTLRRPAAMAGDGRGECGSLPAETRMAQTGRGLAGETGAAGKVHRNLLQRVILPNVSIDTLWPFEYTDARCFVFPPNVQLPPFTPREISRGSS